MDILKKKNKKRLRRRKGIRKTVFGVKERPRLSIFRSSKNIYCQIIDDTDGVTLASASSLTKDVKDKMPYLISH